jgi:hypothetical protein
MTRGLLLIVVVVACTTSAEERGDQAAARQASRDSLLTTEVVQALVTPTSTGRLIYERPADLSYDSLLVKRPDLVRTADRPKR